MLIRVLQSQNPSMCFRNGIFVALVLGVLCGFKVLMSVQILGYTVTHLAPTDEEPMTPSARNIKNTSVKNKDVLPALRRLKMEDLNRFSMHRSAIPG